MDVLLAENLRLYPSHRKVDEFSVISESGPLYSDLDATI